MNRIKRIGLIGGIGPESTLDYYRRIIAAFQGLQPALSYPEILLYSANLAELTRIMEAKDAAALTAWLLDKVQALHRAGADFVAIGSNSPHVVFEELRSRSPVPLLSIVEETCRKAQELGLKRPGLMGTALTMQSDFYQKTFQRKGMAVVVPEAEDQRLIHHRLFTEIELGILRESTRRELLGIVRRLADERGIDSLILGCTELPLILDREEYGIPFLNTTAIHVEGIVRASLER